LRLLRTVLHALALSGAVLLLAVALTGDRGRVAILRMEAARAELEEQIDALEAANDELELVLEQLRRPGHAAEKLARESLGLVRPDEVVYLDAALIEAPPGPPPAD
jgi:cell division protein FtsB